MNIEELICAIEIGHEIEFRLFEGKYFLQPFYDYNKYQDGEPWFVIYNCTNSDCCVELFRGTCRDIVEFEFMPGICLKDNIDAFFFDAIF